MPTPFDRPALRTKIYVGTDMIGGGKVAFLKLVAERGSLQDAAAAMGITPTRAWFFLDTLQACFRDPLFSSENRTDDAVLTVTRLGHDLISLFAAHDAKVQAASEPFLEWLNTVQPER